MMKVPRKNSGSKQKLSRKDSSGLSSFGVTIESAETSSNASTSSDRSEDEGISEVSTTTSIASSSTIPTWDRSTLDKYLEAFRKTYVTGRPLLLLLDSHIVDVTEFFIEHPGGASLLLKRSIRFDDDGKVAGVIRDCKVDFDFLNNHQWAARRKVKDLRVAKVVD
jgi:hypothetical protein